MTILEAAQGLIKELNAPAVAHSVYIGTRVDENQEFVQELCVSIRPYYKSKVKVPATFQGYTVVNVPWPKDV